MPNKDGLQPVPALMAHHNHWKFCNYDSSCDGPSSFFYINLFHVNYWMFRWVHSIHFVSFQFSACPSPCPFVSYLLLFSYFFTLLVYHNCHEHEYLFSNYFWETAMREKVRGGERESDWDRVGVRGLMKKREKRDRIERNLILISILAYPSLPMHHT